jgi:hypothetical protein
VAKAALWVCPDAQARKLGEQTGSVSVLSGGDPGGKTSYIGEHPVSELITTIER